MIIKLPATYFYSKTHEWASVSESNVTIGITAFAVEQMNKDIVSVELPKPGATFAQEDVFGVVDSVKAAFDLYAPIGFTVLEVNQSAIKDPAIIADSPFERGWLIRGKVMKAQDIEKLMSPAQYEEFLKSEH